MADLDIYTSIAANLEESGWSSVLSQLDGDTFAKLAAALDGVKDITETQDEPVPSNPADAVQYLSERFDKVVKGIKAHRKRLEAIDIRLGALEAGGGGGNAGAATTSRRGGAATTSRGGAGGRTGAKKGRRRKLKSQADMAGATEEKEVGTVDDTRKHYYRFGSRNLQVIKPLDGYPNRADARSDPVQGDLTLAFVHGYNGQSEDARQNICVSPDGQYMIYFIAAVGIVYNVETKEQKFFRRHNDDITTICLDPREGSTLVATGQKDPKDTPGQGKDLPKVWIWDYSQDDPTRKPRKLLENICWGKVSRVQWSQSGLLYVLGGDEQQTLKIFDSAGFNKRGPCPPIFEGTTYNEQIYGFVINPNPSNPEIEELVFYGKKKVYWVPMDTNNFGFSKKAVTFTKFGNDKTEKAVLSVQYLPNGDYVAAASSGTVYLCRRNDPLAFFQAHAKAVGGLCWLPPDHDDHDPAGPGTLITAGMDGLLKRWNVRLDIPDSSPEQGGGGARGGRSGRGRGGRGGGKKAAPRNVGDAFNLVWQSSDTDEPFSIPDSDFHLMPRCVTYNNVRKTVYVGSKTNQVMAYDFKEPELLVDGHDGAIWGLCTSPTDPRLFLTGGYDNAVKLWDAEQRVCIATTEFELEEGDRTGNQVSAAAWSTDGQLIAIGSEQSNIFLMTPDLTVLSMYTIEPKTANAAVEKIAYLRFSPDNQYLGVAHMDSQVYVLRVNAADGFLEPLGVYACVAAPTNLQWSENFEYNGNPCAFVKVLTRDYEIVHLRVNFESSRNALTFYPGIPLPEDVVWADDPLIAGWDVEGLYQPGWDGTDLNDATVTSDGQLIVSGDDYGTIRLHNYPAIAPEACKPYTGHAEFVVGVEFLRDDSQLITCGGEDKAIMQWVLTRAE